MIKPSDAAAAIAAGHPLRLLAEIGLRAMDRLEGNRADLALAVMVLTGQTGDRAGASS